MVSAGVAGWWFVVRNLGAAGVLGVTALAVGRALLAVPVVARRPAAEGAGGAWEVRLAGGLETVSVAAALGLVAVGYAGLLLGLAGWLRPGPIVGAMVALNAASLAGWRRLAADWSAAAARMGRERWGRWVPFAVGVAVAPLLLLTLYPPTAFDATSYHLPYARAFVATGSLPFLPGLRYPIFPQLQEVLFALLMAFADDVATQAVALGATALTVALVVAWGRRFSREASWVAAAAYAGCPLVVYLATTSYIEPGLVLCSTAALFAVALWRDGGGEGWLTLAAVFGGAAADSKYLGLFSLALVGLAAAVLRPPGESGSPWRDWRRWRRLARVALVGGLVIAPWYGRIVAATGNPVFPFLPEVFGESPWVAREFHSLAGAVPRLGSLALGLLRAPWDAVLARQRLGGYPPYSPVFLIALPVLPAAFFADARVRALLLTAAGYGLVVFVFLPDARYLLLALPLVSLAMGEGVIRMLAAWGRWRRRQGGWLAPAAALLALTCYLPGWLYAGYRLHVAGPLPLTRAGRETFLARSFAVYPAIRYLNGVCGSSYTLYALHAENMLYFAAGRFLGDWSGPASYGRVVPVDGDAGVLYQRLRALGVDHFLVTAADPQPPPVHGAVFRDRFRAVYADGGAQLFALRGTECRNDPIKPR
jgi:Dolichyl-phosphate-mannose-protein mannosyltransferase